MRRAHFLTHPEVVIDPAIAITDWPLSARGQERVRQALGAPCFRDIGAIHASTERKTTDTAQLVARQLGLSFATHFDLGENDRSSTGYLPRDEFEQVADLFFATPTSSVRGWARAVDEQRRIVTAVRRIMESASPNQTTLIISHGAVGALIMADLLDVNIDRSYDQPGDGGGNWFAFDGASWSLIHGWRVMDW